MMPNSKPDSNIEAHNSTDRLNIKPKPCRTALYMPGSNERALEKAKNLAADSVIFDLEDAVAPEMKQAARTQVCDALAAGGYGQRLLVVRVNGLETQWGMDDVLALVALASHQPDAILLPKVNAADDVLKLARHLPQGVAIWAMIETPQAVLKLPEIAATAQQVPLKALVFGSNDLVKDMRAQFQPDRAPLAFAMSQLVLAARAYDLLALDGVFNDIEDDQGLQNECAQGAAFGFDGKTLIHPRQLETANRVFAPSPNDIAEAKAIIAAFEQAENAGAAVLKVNGKMTEILHYHRALQLIALANQIAEGQKMD